MLKNFFHNLMFDVKRLVSLEAFAAKDYGVSDLLLFSRFIDEGVIILVDGSFTTSFWYRGEDLDSATDDVINYLSTIVNNALSPLGTGWSMHLDCVRRESSGYIREDKCHFPDATTATIDLERRMDYNKESTHYENEYVITFTYLPPADMSSKFGAFFLNKKDGGKPKFDYTIHLEKFKDTIYSVIDILTSSQFKIARMSDNEILSHLFYCINGIHANIKVPARHWTDLRYMLANQDITTGFYPMVGDKHMRVISMGEQFPMESYPTLLSSLNNLGFDYRWSTRYIFLNIADAKAMLKKISDLHNQGRESASQVFAKSQGLGNGKINRAADRYLDETEEAIASIETGGVRFGKYTSCIVLFDEDSERLLDKVKIVETEINNCNLRATVEKAQSFEAYLGSVPSMVRPNVRKWIMHSHNLADLMPTTSVWSGYKSNPCSFYTDAGQDQVLFYASTIGGTPFRGCLHYGNNGHTLLIGDNVSPAINFLAAQQRRYANAKIFIFDNQHASLPLCYGVGGIHYDLGYGDKSITFQPLANLDTQEDFTFAVEWLVELCVVNGFEVKPQHITIITEVLEMIKKEASKTQRTLSYFSYQIRSRDEDLAIQFKPYVSTTGSGLQNILFDAKEDHLELSNFTVFELEQLARKGNSTLIPSISYLFHMIERSLDGTPVSIYLHDGFTILKHPVFRSFLDDWLRNIAGANVQIIIGATNPSDIIKSEIAGILMQTCQTKIFTPNLNAKNQQKQAYLDIGLNEKQIELISLAMPNREYYYTNPLGNRLINFNFGELTTIFVRKPSLEQVDIARKLKAEHGDKFSYQWIKQNNLIDEISEVWLAKHNEIKGENNAE